MPQYVLTPACMKEARNIFVKESQDLLFVPGFEVSFPPTETPKCVTLSVGGGGADFVLLLII